MKKVNIKAIADAVVGVIGRFYPVLIFVLGVAVMAFLDINRKDFNPEFYVDHIDSERGMGEIIFLNNNGLSLK